MTIQEIERLIGFIERLALEEVRIETEQIKLHIKRSYTVPPSTSTSAGGIASTEPPLRPVDQAAGVLYEQPLATPQGPLEAGYITIKSPMIGTFYRSPGPNKPPFVEVGASIEAGQPLCVIEAMKLFNEIEAEVAGTVIKILVEDASPVEYDQPLFLFKPA